MVGHVAITRLVGCLLGILAAAAHGQQLTPREPALPLMAAPLPFGTPTQPGAASLAQAQAAYAQALTLEQAKQPASVDYYYAAISASWLALTPTSSAASPPPLDPQAWALLPGSSTNLAELFFVEPYRPGRIPVVFVHGLLSEPSTWVDPVNDLRAVPQVAERFQFWGFRYPTATSLLDSAAALRELLPQAVATVDPWGTDPALRQMVLVGHSMGGLVSKMQVTSSGSAIWSRVANRPPETIVADEAIKARLRRDTFFEPSPLVRRVVFVGTPHGGSTLASNWIGRLASWYIDPSPESTRMHQLLIQSNPNTFSRDVMDGFPTSVDLLEPASPLLAALQQMPVNPQVRMHSIIGGGYPTFGSGDSDGVVPVSSARHPGVQTETLVRAWHTEIHNHPETRQALLYILSMHYAEYQGMGASGP